MEKSQSDLCREVLRRLQDNGVLNSLILVGSWCLLVYERYFRRISYHAAIRTRDLDFLIPLPQRFDVKVDLQSLLKDLGFIIDFKGEGGWITFQHPDLILEFLVPQRSRGDTKPVSVPALGINAQSLRFLDFLAGDTVRLRFQGLAVTVPHPATFGLHKLIIAPRRKSDKSDRDRSQAIQVLKALIDSGEAESIRQRFHKLPAKWRTPIRDALAAMNEDAILGLLA